MENKQIKSLKLIYFSPTDSTKIVMQGIADELNCDIVDHLDLTLPKNRQFSNLEINEDLVIIGTPVHEMRIPQIMREALLKLKGKNQPVVLISVYGNGNFGKSLKELNSIIKVANFKLLAAATFIGQHSFSTKGAMLAENRPDEDDKKKIKEFGKLISEKFQDDNITEILLPVKIPFMMRFMPKNSVKILTFKPDVDESCAKCMLCCDICPAGAIDKDLEVDNEKCIRCFSCAKKCPKQARKIKYKIPFVVKNFLKTSGKIRKEPEFYL